MAAVAFPGWHFHADTWGIIGFLGLAYFVALRRHSMAQGRHPTASVTRGQKSAFTAGLAVLWIGSNWPVHDLAEGYLYSIHMTQHLLFTLVAALLLVMGVPEWMARSILRPAWLMRTVRGLARPVPSLIQANLILVLSHWPLVVNATVGNHPLHLVAHSVLLVSAVLMWLPVVSPLPEIRRLRPPLQMLYLFGQTILPTVPASFLTFGTQPLYEVYVSLPRLWGISVLTDQQTAGLIMKLAGGFYLWIVITIVFFRWASSEERKDRAGQRDVVTYEDVRHELVT